MNLLKKIIGYLSIVCYIIILGLVLVLSPMVVGYKPVVVLSGSMEPTYPVGSLIYYKAADFDSIEENDNITFYIDGTKTLVTHRVVQKNDISQTFVTKGDANPEKDIDPVDFSNVAGKTMNFCLPKIGKLFDSSGKMIGVAVIAFILILNVILSNVIKEDDNKKKREIV